MKQIPIKRNTIFVSIASYRDPLCPTTLQSLYSNAAHPQNIFCGIVQQNNPDKDEDCLLDVSENIPQQNIRIMRISEYEAKGPTWARYLASKLVNGEEYFFQIDSHTKFVKNWDIKLIDMIQRIKNLGLSDKPLISHYPKDIKSYDDKNSDIYMVPRICKAFFDQDGMINYHGAEIKHTNNNFYRIPYATGGMLFGESTMLNNVPYDPNLPYLFIGEEILHSARLYTAGYDIFTPSENIIFHEYTREGKPKYWSDNHIDNRMAREKVKKIIGLDSRHELPSDITINMDKYGLGKVRTIQDFLNFAGIDIKNKIIRSDFCQNYNQATNKEIKDNKKNYRYIILFCIIILLVVLFLFLFWHFVNKQYF